MALGEVAYSVVQNAGKDVIFFPIWWYTKGIVYVLEKITYSARRQSALLAIDLWVKNIFVPMYGQRDWQGRIISFFIRLLQIVARSVAYGAWLMVLAATFVFYIIIPPLLLFFFFIHARLAV